MKKEFFFVLMLFLTTVGIQAQDTINRLSPKYYVNHPHWSDDTLKLDTAYCTSRYWFSANAHGETAKQCYAKDSLKIYGVAAAIDIGAGQSQSNVIDTFMIRFVNTSGSTRKILQGIWMLLPRPKCVPWIRLWAI